MNTFEILATIDAELARLEQVRILLTENPLLQKRGKSSREVGSPKRGTMSPEGRARVAAAQRARWAKAKRA
jgi:hypothetical protein